MITLNSISHTYPGESEAALRDVSLTLADATVTALVGPNGSGKTTLTQILGGLLPPSSGSVSINGTEMSPNAQEQTRNWQTGPLLAHIQPEHRTPGERWAAILRPVDSALPRAHPQDDIASHRTQIVVRFAPNTRFRRISPKWTAL